MGNEVFISHSTIDGHLVNILIEFLNNIGVNNDNIFCTSISGGLEGGKSFVEQIKNNVQSSKVVIFLLTERFFLSYFCLAELGAAWALNQNVLPIIVPPISTTEYNSTPLISIQALSMDSVNFASEFFNNLIRKNVTVSDNIADKDEMLKNLNTKVKKELYILRKDSKGFYVARLSEPQTRKTQQILHSNQSQMDQFLFGKRNNALVQTETLWKLNGQLDIDDSSKEHWIKVGAIDLI